MRSLILVIAAGLSLAACATPYEEPYTNPTPSSQTPPPPPPPGPGAA